MYPETILPITAHIPHAGTGIPEAVRSQFIPSPEELWREIALVTDWYTAELFGLPGIATTQTLISRVVVDLERYSDDSLEEKSSFGQGVIYTHNALGEKIRRELSLEEKRLLLDTYYRPWHLQLEVNLEQQLQRWGYSLLLDCHSFPDEPFAHEDDQGRHRPDICLGVCCNTPQWLLDSCTGLFLKRGYTVDVDFPYSGCVVPEHFAGDTRVPAVMLEINRRLYLMPAGMESYRLENIPVKATGFEPVRNDIREVMLCLAEESACRLERLPWCNPGSGRGS
jgi:N-formylglutamate amidohydrolase